jgi:Snf7
MGCALQLIRGASTLQPGPLRPQQPNEFSDHEVLILRLKIVRDELFAQITKYTKTIEKCDLEAKKFLSSGDKNRALFSLKRKKLYQTCITKCNAKIGLLEQQMVEIESAQDDLMVHRVIKEVNGFLADVKKEVNISEIETLSENLKEYEISKKQIDHALNEFGVDVEKEVDEDYERLLMDLGLEGNSKEDGKKTDSTGMRSDSAGRSESSEGTNKSQGDQKSGQKIERIKESNDEQEDEMGKKLAQLA